MVWASEERKEWEAPEFIPGPTGDSWSISGQTSKCLSVLASLEHWFIHSFIHVTLVSNHKVTTYKDEKA